MESPSTNDPSLYHLYGCESGGPDYLVLRTDPEAHLLSLRMKCPQEGCAGFLELGRTGSYGKDPRYLSARELFNACMGLGFAGEREVNPARLDAVLTGAVIKSVVIDKENSSSDKSVLESMVVEHRGHTVRVHLASGRYGAVIYRISDE